MMQRCVCVCAVLACLCLAVSPPCFVSVPCGLLLLASPLFSLRLDLASTSPILHTHTLTAAETADGEGEGDEGEEF